MSLKAEGRRKFENSPAQEASPKVLITGLNGLIGWNLFEAGARKYRVFGTHRRRHPRLEGLSNSLRLDMHSRQSLTDLLEAFQPDYLIHTWSMCDLDLCESMPEMARAINVEGMMKMLGAAQTYGRLKKMTYLSTDHVFGGHHGDYHEEDIPEPIHVYGKTKLAAERLLRASGLPYAIVRPGLVIGESLQGNKGPRDFLFNRIRAGRATHYFVDEWRSPIKAEELASRVFQIMTSDGGGVFHAAGEKLYNRFDLARELARENGLGQELIFPRLRREDRWASIRPHNLSLKTIRNF